MVVICSSAEVLRPANGHCWFDFDDSHVRPITEQYLEKQFQGKESAYMLFYRKRSMKRPPQGQCLSHWVRLVPSFTYITSSPLTIKKHEMQCTYQYQRDLVFICVYHHMFVNTLSIHNMTTTKTKETTHKSKNQQITMTYILRPD